MNLTRVLLHMGNCTHPEGDCYPVEFLGQWLEGFQLEYRLILNLLGAGLKSNVLVSYEKIPPVMLIITSGMCLLGGFGIWEKTDCFSSLTRSGFCHPYGVGMSMG